MGSLKRDFSEERAHENPSCYPSTGQQQHRRDEMFGNREVCIRPDWRHKHQPLCEACREILILSSCYLFLADDRMTSFPIG
jgi:hypothetical protein